MTKIAICQIGHPGSLESLVVMLRSLGYGCFICGEQLRDHLRSLELDTVVSAKAMAEGWGTNLLWNLPEADSRFLHHKSILYIDTKAHRNGPKLWKHYPHLESRTLWYRINGARPCIVPGKGDEINPPCSVLTPDPWYNKDLDFNREGRGVLPQSTLDKSYSCWPPFARWDQHQQERVPLWQLPNRHPYVHPVCLTHNLSGWGYGDVGEHLRSSIGLKCYGGYGSPDGLFPYHQIPNLLSVARCLVHLKSQDCPGYSLYEALASACPVIISRMMIAWCKMQDLFIEDVTCLCYDKEYPVEGGAPAVPIDVEGCITEIETQVERLKDPELNRRIGENGRERLRQIMWSPIANSTVTSFSKFMERYFP